MFGICLIFRKFGHLMLGTTFGISYFCYSLCLASLILGIFIFSLSLIFLKFELLMLNKKVVPNITNTNLRNIKPMLNIKIQSVSELRYKEYRK